MIYFIHDLRYLRLGLSLIVVIYDCNYFRLVLS